MGDIGLRLVVVVVGDKVLHRIVGKKLLELGAQLGGQGLVVGQHQSGPLDLLDDLGHGEGLAGAGDPQQGLLIQAHLNTLGQGFDGLRLVAAGLIFRYHLKFRHIVVLLPLVRERPVRSQSFYYNRTNFLMQAFSPPSP